MRAPATMTDPDMVCLQRMTGDLARRYPRLTAERRRQAVRTRHSAVAAHAGVRRCRHEPSTIPAAPVHRASTTSASPCADLDEAIAFYRDTFGMRVVHEEINEEQGVREAMVAVGDSGSCIQLLAPLRPRLDDREVPRPQRPGHPAGRLPRRRHRRGLRDACASAASACSTTSRAAAPPARGSTSCTPRTPAACWSSWSSRAAH